MNFIIKRINRNARVDINLPNQPFRYAEKYI